jgi:hypothetical protein
MSKAAYPRLSVAAFFWQTSGKSNTMKLLALVAGGDVIDPEFTITDCHRRIAHLDFPLSKRYGVFKK